MSDLFRDYVRPCTNRQLADAIGYIAPRLDSELAKAILEEAARRLRETASPHLPRSLRQSLPPLDSHAAPDADTTPIGLVIDQIAFEAITRVR
jgi:hypothetical protein